MVRAALPSASHPPIAPQKATSAPVGRARAEAAGSGPSRKPPWSPSRPRATAKRTSVTAAAEIVSVNDDTDLKDDGQRVHTKRVHQRRPQPSAGAGKHALRRSIPSATAQAVASVAPRTATVPADTPCTDWSCVTTSGTCASAPRSTTTTCGPAPACTSGVEYLQDFCDGAGACRDSGSQTVRPSRLRNRSLRRFVHHGYALRRRLLLRSGRGLPGEEGARGHLCSKRGVHDWLLCRWRLLRNCLHGPVQHLQRRRLRRDSPGSCAPIAAGRDPANECAGGRACNGSNGCTGVQNCDCGTLRYSPYENCCTSCCGSTDCPSQVYPCNTAHGTPLATPSGRPATTGAGQGIVDQSGSCPRHWH